MVIQAVQAYRIFWIVSEIVAQEVQATVEIIITTEITMIVVNNQHQVVEAQATVDS